jgi:probable rRNA maturation factor
MPKINLAITNLQSFIKPRVRKIKALTSFILEQENCAMDGGLSLVLVDDAAITALNKQYLNHGYATDVLSFNLLDGKAIKLPPRQKPLWGEIVISGQTALRQAEEHALAPHWELEHLVAHGILHLLSYDDAAPQQKKLMEERALKLLQAFNADYESKKIH